MKMSFIYTEQRLERLVVDISMSNALSKAGNRSQEMNVDMTLNNYPYGTLQRMIKPRAQ